MRKKKTPPAPSSKEQPFAPPAEAAGHTDKYAEREIIYIPLTDIFASPSNPRRHIDEVALADLAASISKYGVIQPVTVRPKQRMKGKFELVCGERRLLASRKAERHTLPAVIRDLTDDEVMDLQFAENLERQDVHPMDEAVTFQAMIATGRYSVADIALRIVKSESFVAQRLALNNLISEFQEAFWKDSFSIGHAVLFARLTEKDQKECYSRFGKREGYGTLGETKTFIDYNIIRKLSSAPFKRDDAGLVPEAGPCTTCLKRSGCNTSLFADYQEDDRCFDKACFQAKVDAFLIQKVKSTIETKPEILLVDSGLYGDKIAPAVKKLASDMKVEIIEPSYNTLSSYKTGNATPVKVLMVSGTEAGKMKTMYTQSKKLKAAVRAEGQPAKRTKEDVQAEIDGLKTRQERALELDSEKVWAKVMDLLESPSGISMEELVNPAHSEDERVCMALALIDKIEDGEYRDKAFEILKLEDLYAVWDISVEDLARIKVTYEHLRAILRLFMISVMRKGAGYKTEPKPFQLMKVLKELPSFKNQVADLEASQAADAEKRIANAGKRMEALVKEKKELEGKPAAKGKKAAKNPAKTKGKRGGIAKLLVEDEPEEMEADELERDFNELPDEDPDDL